MRLAAAIGTARGTASVLAALLVGRAARLRDGIPQPVADRMLTVPGLPQEPAPHPQPHIEPVWALDRDPGHPVGISFVPARDGSLAVFACDTEDFVAARLTRAEVQSLRFGLTTWLCDTAEVRR